MDRPTDDTTGGRRKPNRKIVVPLGDGAEVERDPRLAVHDPDPVDRLHLLQELRMALSRLPKRRAQVFVLRHAEGLGDEEIAARLDTTPGAVRVADHRARRDLQKLLADLAPVLIFLLILGLILAIFTSPPVQPTRPVPIFPRSGLGIRPLGSTPCADPSAIELPRNLGNSANLHITAPRVLVDDFGGRGAWTSTFSMEITDAENVAITEKRDASIRVWLVTADMANIVADGYLGSKQDPHKFFVDGPACESRTTNQLLTPEPGMLKLWVTVEWGNSAVLLQQPVEYRLGSIPEPSLPTLHVASCKLDTEPSLTYIKLSHDAPERYRLIPPRRAISGRDVTFIVAFMPKIDNDPPDAERYPGLAEMTKHLSNVQPRQWLAVSVVVPLRGCADGNFAAPLPPGHYSVEFLYDSALGMNWGPQNPGLPTFTARRVGTTESPHLPARPVLVVEEDPQNSPYRHR